VKGHKEKGKKTFKRTAKRFSRKQQWNR